MGGYKQRLAQHERDAKRFKGNGELARTLLDIWCTGQMSAAGLQRVAAAAWADGVRCDQILRFAKMGAWGAYPSNVHGALLTFLNSDSDLPQPKEIEVPALDSKAHPPRITCAMPVLLPHETVSKMAYSYPEEFEQMFGMHKTKCFWEQVKTDDPRLLRNPIEHIDRRDVVPLWLHGDGVEFGTDSMLAFSFGSLLCDDQSMDSCLLIAGWPKGASCDGTWVEVYRAIAWSFTALWEGRYPDKDWNGKPMGSLAGKLLTPAGTRFYVWQLIGDLDYMCNVLKLPHWNKHEWCWLCNGSKKDATRSFRDVSDAPGWRMLSVEEMHESPASAHPFFSAMPGPVGGLRVGLDMLHTIDLGIAGTLCSSVLFTWVFDHKGPKENVVAKIWAEVQEAYNTLGTPDRLNNLKLGTFTTSSPFRPDMKAKAAETRHLVPALAAVAQNRCRIPRCRTAVEMHCAASLEHLCRFYKLCESQSMFMDRPSAEQASEEMRHCLQHYAWLHVFWGRKSQDSAAFPIRPKLHWAYHIGQACKFQNPRSTWTYKQEDWLGKISAIALSCAHGTRSVRIMKSFMTKYRAILNHRLRNPRHEA